MSVFKNNTSKSPRTYFLGGKNIRNLCGSLGRDPTPVKVYEKMPTE